MWRQLYGDNNWTYDFEDLTANDVFDEIHGSWVWILYFAEYEHLTLTDAHSTVDGAQRCIHSLVVARTAELSARIHLTICDISWVYRYSLIRSSCTSLLLLIEVNWRTNTAHKGWFLTVEGEKRHVREFHLIS